ncbi:MAG: CPBP family intramembrane metalloprotease [Elusimicrobia bacterium]|nr:CPBP family intramembrane metalloprotease [Elusimicrobiota bacterium]
MRSPRLLLVAILVFAAMSLPSQGLGQTVVRTGVARPVSPVSAPLGRVGGPASLPVSPSGLSLSPLASFLPSAPGAVVVQSAAPESSEAPEIPTLTEAVRVDEAGTAVVLESLPSLERSAVEETALIKEGPAPISGALKDSPAGALKGSPPGETAQKLSAARDSLAGTDLRSMAEEAKSRSGAAFGETRPEKASAAMPEVVASQAKRGLFQRLLPARWQSNRTAVKAEPSKPASSGVREEPPSRLANLRNLIRGAFYGLVLIVSPIATSFALDPLDSALGLQPFPLLKYLTEAFPAFGVPFAWLWSGFSILIPVLGFLAVKKGLKSLAPSKPLIPLALAGGALAVTVFYAAILQSIPAMIVLSMLSTAVLATGEEVMFRGKFLPWLKKKFEVRGWRLAAPLALVLSSVVFSLVHLPVHSFTLDLFALKLVLGLVLGLLYLKTGSLVAPAAAHSAYNIAVSVLAPLLAALAGLPLFGIASIAVLSVVLAALRAGWFARRPKGPVAA